jgi:hypothetical protein
MPVDETTIPGPKPAPIIGTLSHLDPEAPVQSLMKLSREYGPIAGARTRRPPMQTRLVLLTKHQYDADVRLMHQIADELVAERKKQATPAITETSWT